ncbi:2-oxoglutarate dehydrogenase E1 subunit family protein, partial [Streptomyces sp. MI02-7b]
MSPQSPNSSSSPSLRPGGTPRTETDGQGQDPAAGFGPNEWLVDEIYQQYLQDPNSVDRAWWDFFADYKPGADTGSAVATGRPATPPPAAPAAPPAASGAAAPAPVSAPAPAAPAPAAPAAPA